MSKSHREVKFSRREFLRWSASAVGGLLLMPVLHACQRLGLMQTTEPPTHPAASQVSTSIPDTPAATLTPQVAPTVAAGVAQVAFVKTRDRTDGTRQALSLLGQNTVAGKRVLLKPNFNSADTAPASTHPATLQALIQCLQQMRATSITVADRSGMGETRQVMERLGIFAMAEKLGFDVLIFDELTKPQDWMLVRTDGDHWQNGFPVPHRLLEADAVVQTCCLKPHRFGGHFTLSLKNTVGMIGKHMGNAGYNYMTELHSSPSQRLMIAEANAVYNPDLILLDGVEAFVDQGPDQGTKVWGEVILAGNDRVAIDAVGLALLRHLGYNGIAADGPIFSQEQIARAVELGLGIDDVQKIEFLTDDPDSASYAGQIRNLMLQSG